MKKYAIVLTFCISLFLLLNFIHVVPISDNQTTIDEQALPLGSLNTSDQFLFDIREKLENENISLSSVLELFTDNDSEVNRLLMLEINKVSTWYDWDKDGLLDYDEIYRNFTNPELNDTDGDGVLDGDWEERKEYTYTVEVELRLFKPYDLAFMQSHLYQDVKILEEQTEYADILLLLYPFTSYNQTIVPNFDWKASNVELLGELEPGLWNDWNHQMQIDLYALLAQHDIHPETLSDLELVYEVIALFDADPSKLNIYENFKNTVDQDFLMYDWYLTHAEDGSFTINEKALLNRPEEILKISRTIEKTRTQLESVTGEYWSNSRVWNIMGSMKAAFYERLHGSSSSTAGFYATIFQALGIPTKVMPYQTVIDYTTDMKESQLSIEHRLNQGSIFVNDRIKRDWMDFVQNSQSGSNQVTNLIFIGNRWVNIDIAGGFTFNYATINQNYLIFTKLAEYDYTKTQDIITENWLQYRESESSSLLKSESFDSIFEQIKTAVEKFNQKTYGVSDAYGQHIQAETLKMIYEYTDLNFQSVNGKYKATFFVDQK